MIIGEILELVGRLFDILLSMLGLGTSAGSAALSFDPNMLRVFIKYSGKSIQVDLDPSWSVAQVKTRIAPELGVEPQEIKIIFAGNELPDDFILKSCDVGQQSYLHAVRVHVDNQTKNDIISQDPATTSSSSSSNANEQTMPEHSEISSQVLANRTRTFSNGPEELFTFHSAEESPFSDDPMSISIAESNSEESDWVKVSSPVTVQSQSNFFVFCSECTDLKEGKLRVRCAKCLSGAFTVSSHPQGWDDVIIPSQIEGSCETEGCDGKFAQFYFKCTCHVTKGEDDSSSPLPLIQRNSESVPCLACGDIKELILLFPCEMSHVTCVDCFKDYSLVKLNQREFVQDSSTGYTLGCPALCENSLIKDPHHFKLLGKYQYDRYQRFGTEECLLQLGGLFCPQPDCGMGIIPADSNCDKIACLHGCGYVFCRKCLEGWHIGDCRDGGQSSAPAEDCSSGGYMSAGYFVSEDRAAAAQWGDPSRRALRLSTKPCPNCRVPTERDGGCMHMECTKCKFQWCWVCQTKWNRECMGNHWFG